MASHLTHVIYRFGPWRYQPSLRLLSANSGEQRLKPLSDRLLNRLLADPGLVVSRDQLIEEVWTRKQVNDEVLSRAIAELRSLLGDDARHPQFIETLAKGGYRWIADTQRLSEPAESASTSSHLAGTSSRMPSTATWIIGVAVFAAVVGAAWLLRSGAAVQPTNTAALDSADLLLARPLTAHSSLELDPSFDPIGRVVYIRADAKTGGSELVMVSAQGDAERVLWEEQTLLRHPTVSPDGSVVALVRRIEDRSCEVFSVSVLNQRVNRLARCPDRLWGGVAWSPDGESLLYTAPGDAEHAPGLALLNRQTGAIRSLTTPTLAAGAHLDPRLSPDGKTLVYASQHGTDQQLWWTDWPQMRQHKALLGRPEPVYDHAFEPDGQALWIAGDLISYRALNRLRLHPGGIPELLGARGAQSIDIAADGSAVWSVATHDADVLIGREGQPDAWPAVAQSNRYEAQPAFSPDGQSLVMISNRGGTESVIVLGPQRDAAPLDLRLDSERRWVRPTWSADSRSLILSAYRGHHTELYRYGFEGGVLSPIEGVGVDAFGGIELQDRLLYIDASDSARTLMQLRANGETEALPLGPVASFRASEQWLVWHRPGESKLQAVPIDRWDEAHEIAILDPLRSDAFALAANRAYYAADRELWSKTLPDGKVRMVTEVPYPSAHGPSLAVSVQGEWAVSVRQSLQMDLMIAKARPDPPLEQ